MFLKIKSNFICGEKTLKQLHKIKYMSQSLLMNSYSAVGKWWQQQQNIDNNHDNNNNDDNNK